MIKVYAYKNVQEEVNKASSGGAFYKILTVLVDSFCGDYVIYGATWTDDLRVEHQRVESLELASKFRGSKYVRSDISGIFVQVSLDLSNDKNVIFSGTPCQIQGLKSYLSKKNINTEKLFTIDIICHGSPEPRIWRDCKEWFEKKEKSRIVHVSFRDKRSGWKRYPTSILFSNGKEIINTYESQIYMRMFFSLMILDKKCFSCKYSNMNRVSDITIGDFWGINEIMPDFPAKQGVSLILINTKEAEIVISDIEKSLSNDEVLKEYSGNKYLRYQHNLNRPTEKPCRYDEFWNDYNEKGFQYIIEKYRFNTMKGYIKFGIKSALLKFGYFDNSLS